MDSHVGVSTNTKFHLARLLVIEQDIISRFRVKPGKKFKLDAHDPAWVGTDEFEELGKAELKEHARALLDKNLAELAEAQSVLYADDRYSILIVLQAMDAAGKDGTVKHVMSGVNPQGCQVFSFKKPSIEELDHDFLWRCSRCLPERGRIGIFNRSYYEDVLVVKVHPELLGRQSPQKIRKKFWKNRYEDINSFERHLVRNGTIVLKFFLNMSKSVQKKRFLERIDEPSKNWKFSAGDVVERGFWDDYMKAYEDALGETSTKWAPWYVVPADHKWVTRTVVAGIVTAAIRGLDLKYPELTQDDRKRLAESRQRLIAES
jgi:PPK2 family polyphosphate:nucleotide phosphotransferase